MHFNCPNCQTSLTYGSAGHANTNCPICGSGIYLDQFGVPSLRRVGPPTTPKGSKAATGAILGGLLGALLGGGPGAILGAAIGGAVGSVNESPHE